MAAATAPPWVPAGVTDRPHASGTGPPSVVPKKKVTVGAPSPMAVTEALRVAEVAVTAVAGWLMRVAVPGGWSEVASRRTKSKWLRPVPRAWSRTRIGWPTAAGWVVVLSASGGASLKVDEASVEASNSALAWTVAAGSASA